MLISNSLPISLRTVLNQLAPSTTPSSTDTFNSGSGTITAPSGTTFVEILLWGGGGAGRSGGVTPRGGGGGGFMYINMPVVGGVTQFEYSVGAGGTGVVNGNGYPGTYSSVRIVGMATSSTHFAGGGSGGTSNNNPPGGGVGGNAYLAPGETFEPVIKENGSSTTTTTGGNAAGSSFGGGSGGAGGTSGSPGTAPGGGGGASTSTANAGGAGAAGRVVFRWYNSAISTANELTDLYAGSSYVSVGAVGENGIIPSSGSINLKNFAGYTTPRNANLVCNVLSEYEVYAFGGTAYNNTSFSPASNGKMIYLGADESVIYFSSANTLYSWLTLTQNLSNPNISGLYEVKWVNVSGTVPGGAANNTWYAGNSNPVWVVNVGTTGSPSINELVSYGRFVIRLKSSTEVANIPMSITSRVSIYPPD